ncbi:MAG: thiol:disulfide interchange protein [Gammaproteobacteria bacterium]|jgi:cytochrome c biogenesis protein CcmG/thiol:disulfide interchange protein DsbE|nr:thiol:disulfide interchange protein [Gammaproteobacteria bacterium]
MKRIKYFLPLLIFIAIALFFWKGLQKDPHEIPSALIGKPVPAFNYPALTGNQPLTNKIFIGKVSLLNVWATWCPTCYAEHAVLLDIMRTPNLVIYGLNYKDDRTKAEDWIKENGNPYQAVIYDAKGTLAMDLGVYGAPETFVIDKKGIIRYKHIGAVSPNVWETKLKPLLEKLNHE